MHSSSRAYLAATAVGIVLQAASVTMASAQSTFVRNDNVVWSQPKIRIDVLDGFNPELPEIPNLGGYAHHFTLGHPGVSNYGLHHLEYIRVDYDNNNTWDQMVGGGAWTFPEPIGLFETRTIRIQPHYYYSDFDLYWSPVAKSFDVTVARKPRIYVGAGENALVQVRDVTCTNKIPVLLVEGFDALNNTYPWRYNKQFQALLESINALPNCEAFILNFNNGGQDIRQNATVLMDALAKLHELCPNTKIAIIGYSMGESSLDMRWPRRRVRALITTWDCSCLLIVRRRGRILTLTCKTS